MPKLDRFTAWFMAWISKPWGCFYITPKQALGFTHHGKYYGLPIWIADIPDCPVATKHPMLDWLFTLFTYVEQFMLELMDEEPSFRFEIHEPIVINIKGR